MRVVVHGARGKVGAALVAQIAEAGDLQLGEAIGGRGDLPGARFSGEVVIDFSSPQGTAALLDALAGNPLPVVIGTTGFDEAGAARIAAAAVERPLLVAPNFTLGFEPFRSAARALAAALPGAGLIVGEVYNAAKKPAPSGTTQDLVRALTTAARRPETEIGRVGDTPGINTVTLDLGVSRIDLTLTVQSRAAYAAGALAAARWLIGRPAGLYSPTDMFRSLQ
ncbi:dihydrodipicolinate reductase C-terminal domain-containing protein (plasmid) [Salipiger sp. H15]|uniref:4-hydroxy-tetrahydrodipicolinate reductase n=1 Tax=Alloyangia sp. H15 TaxID=3029062 RepID=A0AAU8AQ11_9RHOB